MDATQIETAIRELLVKELGLKLAQVETLTPDTPLLGRGLGLDSMEVLTLTTALEERFSVRVDDTELTPDLFRSLGSLTTFMRSKMNCRSTETGTGDGRQREQDR